MSGTAEADAGAALAEALEPIARVIVDTLQSDLPPGIEGPAAIDQDTDAFDAAYGDPVDLGYRHPLHLLSLVIASRLYLIADTLEGIALLGRYGTESTPPVSYSAQAIARTALDAAAFCYWMAEPDIGHDERVKRFVQDTMHEVKSGNRVAQYAAKDGILLPSSVDELIDMCDAYHVPYRRPYNEGDLPKVGKRPSAGSIMAPLMKSEEYLYLGAVLYSEVSDVAHASISGILKLAGLSAAADSIDVGFARHEVLRRLFPLVWAMHAPLTAAFEYLGWDATKLDQVCANAAEIVERKHSGN